MQGTCSRDAASRTIRRYEGLGGRHPWRSKQSGGWDAPTVSSLLKCHAVPPSSPEHASQLTLPSTGRRPSTVSARQKSEKAEQIAAAPQTGGVSATGRKTLPR